MLTSQLTSGFIERLRCNDEAAWFELWETFGPVIRAQLVKWGKGRIGAETVRDLSQETMAALSDSIDRFDPERGARFSTWLLAIAKHVLGDEIDRRTALKRGGGRAAASLDESWMVADAARAADAEYEAAIFRAKVEAAIRKVEHETDFADFEIYRMRVFDGVSGKEVAAAVGVSEPTVSRRLARVRDLLRVKLAAVMQTYSFTAEEYEEAARNGIALNPKAEPGAASPQPETDFDPGAFDEAVCEIYHRQTALRRADEFDAAR